MGLLNRTLTYSITAGIMLFPLIFLPFTQEFFLTHKLYMLIAINCIVLVLLAASLITSRKIHLINSPFTKILVLFFFTQVISLVFASTNKIQALLVFPVGLVPMGILTLTYLIALYIYAQTKKELPIKHILAAAGLVAAIVSIIFYFKPFDGITLSPTLEFLKNQNFSLVGNIFDSVIFYGFLLTGAIISIISHIRTKKHSSVAPYALYSIFIAVAAGLIISKIFFAPSGQSLQLPPVGHSWAAAVETLKQPKSALIGVGIDNYDVLFTLTKSASYNRSPLWQTNFDLSRSTLLHIWAETGLLGLITMLVLILYVVRELHGLFVHKDSDAVFYAALATYLGALLIFLPPSFISFFLLYTYLIALSQKIAEYDHDAIKDINLKDVPFAYITLAALLVLFAGGLAFFSVRAYRAEYYFKKSIDAIRLNKGQDVYTNLKTAIQINPYIERYRNQFSQINLILANNLAGKKDLNDNERKAVTQFVQQSITEAKALVALNPQRARNWNTLAVVYRSITNVAEGANAWTIAAYQESIKRDPNNPSLRLNLGGVFYSQKKYDSAALSFERAVVLRPSWANAHYNYAWALFEQGKTQDAVTIMKNVLTLLDKKSKDYTLAQENLKVFQEKLDTELKQKEKAGSEEAKDASSAGKLPPQPEKTAIEQAPLALPATPAAQLSPAIQLPEGAGP